MDNLLTVSQFGPVVLGHGFPVYVGYRTCRRLFAADDHGARRALAPMLVVMAAWSAFDLWVLIGPMTARN